MDGLEEKLGAVLNNPQLMEQIMGMASALGEKQPPQEQAPPQSSPLGDLGIDFATLQRIASMASSCSIDSQQKTLLTALTPYLHQDRISRLEKAMRSARLAKLAGSAFAGGIFSSGR